MPRYLRIHVPLQQFPFRQIPPMPPPSVRQLPAPVRRQVRDQGPPSARSAERAWGLVSVVLPNEEFALLASAQHWSWALWRRDWDDAMLAVRGKEEVRERSVEEGAF